MNDLQTLRAVLLPTEPAQEVVDRSRHRLQNRMLGAPRRRRRPLVLGTGLAAAAAAAIVVATLPGAPAEAPRPQAVAPVVTGQDVLLAAATVAAKAPSETGTYWHVVTTSRDLTYESWTTADGHQWFRGAKSGGRVVPLGQSNPFRLGVVDVTLDQLRALPTDPTALRDWIAEALKHSDARTSAGPLTASDREQALLESLVSLVSALPAPPGVRAAAFRAIAAYPGVRDLGAVPGGRGLVLPGEERLVVAPATGRVNGTSTFVTADGAVYHLDDPRGAAISAEWTDSLPR
ncbi:CU044_5270 family protein [Amycolatopsis sp. FDAARGOS 1241]|uniref:CU044_5270 family protein n=1 Tax=Amycolatopsis sp. FDAARGOS 1241 TaxID=2778070 RepID=UPI00194F30A8|nr:CU044_5270 family protein [Amycolatopsis sp. FDAARGOS 1241]QRP47969.1 CU044_5270 family protein [Amycolatopsis sp. FDAARGOS 1241]QRP49049.1 CU044_5270 family protein [Amycolatopsis sp. FDAARGOS 1241]